MQRLAIKSPFDLYYYVIIPLNCYLSEPKVPKHFLFDGNDQPVYATELAYVVTAEGVLTGYKCSFAAKLSDSVVLDISGDDIAARTTSDSWKHCYLPLQNPLNVMRGDEIHWRYQRSDPSLRNSPFRQCYRWSGTVERQGDVIGAFSQSTGNSE